LSRKEKKTVMGGRLGIIRKDSVVLALFHVDHGGTG
jgi:hypothetical protein